MCEEHNAEPHSDKAIYAFLSHILVTAEEDKGNFIAAEKHLLTALKIRQKLNPPVTEPTVNTLNNLGLLYNSMNNLDKGIECYKEGIALLKQRLPHEDCQPLIKMSEHNIARCVMQKGDLSDG